MRFHLNKVISYGNVLTTPEVIHRGENVILLRFGYSIPKKRKMPDGQWINEAVNITVKFIASSEFMANKIIELRARDKVVITDGSLAMERFIRKDGTQGSRYVIETRGLEKIPRPEKKDKGFDFKFPGMPEKDGQFPNGM